MKIFHIFGQDMAIAIRKRQLINLQIWVGLCVSLIFLLSPLSSPAQQTINGSITHDALQRDFILYVPASYNPGTPAPLVFNFHGFGSNAFEQLNYGDFRAIADTAGFLVVHPMGTLDNGGNTHWNVGWGTSTTNDVGFTEALIDSLSAIYNLDPNKIYSTGMSNGGFMSLLLACELSDRLAAVASVTGSMTLAKKNSCNPQHPTPILQMHGTADATVPYNGQNPWTISMISLFLFWTNYNACDPIPDTTYFPDINPTDGSTVTHYLYKNGNNGVEEEHFRIENGGHTWPGSAFVVAGTNLDIKASVEIWRFFRKYCLNDLLTGYSTPEKPMQEAVELIYPNPVNSSLNLLIKGSTSLPFELYNPEGKMLQSGQVEARFPQIDVRELGQGIYFLRVGGQTFRFLKSISP